MNVGFTLPKEKLLCLMVLDDRLASRLSSTAGEAFWRAFIVSKHLAKQPISRRRWRGCATAFARQ